MYVCMYVSILILSISLHGIFNGGPHFNFIDNIHFMITNKLLCFNRGEQVD